MATTIVRQHLRAPRARVYGALLDAAAVRRWMVPDGMSSVVHSFDSREGGWFRISLTYERFDGVGKTTPHTDTHHGRFVKLVPEREVVEVVEFESDDPAMQGEMTVTISIADGAHGGTELTAVHAGLPAGVAPSDNETGWRMSLAKLARLVEGDG